MAAEANLELLFHTFDRDRSGSLSIGEWTDLCSTLEVPEEEINQIFSLLDSTKRGSITLDAFLHGFETVTNLKRYSSQASLASASIETLTEVDDGHKPWRSLPVNPSLIRSRSDLRYVSLAEEDSSNEDSFMLIAGDNRKIFKMNDYLQGLDNCSQEQVCELYRVLHGEYPQLVQPFEAIILDFVRDIRNQQSEQERLERTLHREKEIHVSHLSQLEEEMESHMKRIEGKVREEVSERVENEYSDLLEQKRREVEELNERIRKIQEASAEEDGEDSVCALKATLASVQHENRCLKSEMTETETRLTLYHGELKSLRQEVSEKRQELARSKQMVVDYMKEQDKLQHQLSLLRDANRKLHDQNDDLRSAVEDYSQRSLGTAAAGRVSRQASTLSRSSEATLSVCDPVFTKRDPLLPAHDTCEVDSLPDDMDSGLSTMRDITEVDSELDIAAQRVVPSLLVQQSRPALKAISSDSDYEPKESEFDTEVERRAKLRLHHQVGGSDFLSAECSLRSEMLHDGSDSCHEAGSGGGSRRSPARRVPNRRSGRLRQRPVQCRSKTRIGAQVDVAPTPTGAPERMFKVVLCGDAAVGKSSFIMRLCKGKFVSNMTSTLGVDFHPKTISVDGRIFSLQLWDTAGQERFRSLAKNYFRKVDGVLLLYDCTYERSFINVRDWMNTVQEEAEKDIPVMIVGNKTDLRDEMEAEGKRVVSNLEGKRLAQEYEALFIETSAKSGEHTLESVTELARLMCTQQDLQVKNVNVRLTTDKPATNSNCCNM